MLHRKKSCRHSSPFCHATYRPVVLLSSRTIVYYLNTIARAVLSFSSDAIQCIRRRNGVDFVIALNCGTVSVLCIPGFYGGFFCCLIFSTILLFVITFSLENIQFEQHSTYPLSHDRNCKNKQMSYG